MSGQDEIEKAIKNNDLYSLGDWLPTDWEQAFKHYQLTAESGDPKAQFNVGYCYSKGDVMDQDHAKAFEWYQKAAKKGDARAHYNLSQMYERGEFVKEDRIKAKEHFDKAIELGDERPKNKVTLASAKEALKNGDREEAKKLFKQISMVVKEAEMGVLACDAEFKSVYTITTNYSYHSSGSGKYKKFWKWADGLTTNVDINMTNNSILSWRVYVKALCRGGDGAYLLSTIGGVLRTKEVRSNFIKLEEYGSDAKICGVEVFSDAEGSPDKPVYMFAFPDISIIPDDEEKAKLSTKLTIAGEEMKKHNQTAKPNACFVLTACYGSYDAPTVLVFRQFRDNYLAQSRLGRRFITWYYTHGPAWAASINNKPRVKAVFRALFNQMAKILPH